MTTTAAKAVIDLIEEENLLANAAETGAYLRGKLEELQQKHTITRRSTRHGPHAAIELVRDRKTKEPAVGETAQLMEAALENRLLVGKGGVFGNAIRISPPLNIRKSDVDEFARLLDTGLGKCSESHTSAA